MLAAGEDFDGYVVDRELGRGGCATVYQAHGALNPDHVVALKVLREDHRSAAERTRLNREFEFAHGFDHCHIVTVYEHGPSWLTMQYVDGGNSTRLQRLDERLAALAQIADALDYVHRHGIVHCDVKPANILVDEDFSGTGAVLIDFGVARALVDAVSGRPKQLHASLPYAAPELLIGRPPAAATDEYALACSTVELLTGAPPFTADSATELVDAHLSRVPPRISRDVSWLSPGFDAVLATAMAKNPEERYRSCTEFVEHVRRAMR